jgi:hypothetical protein
LKLIGNGFRMIKHLISAHFPAPALGLGA